MCVCVVLVVLVVCAARVVLVVSVDLPPAYGCYNLVDVSILGWHYCP